MISLRVTNRNVPREDLRAILDELYEVARRRLGDLDGRRTESRYPYFPALRSVAAEHGTGEAGWDHWKRVKPASAPAYASWRSFGNAARKAMDSPQARINRFIDQELALAGDSATVEIEVCDLIAAGLGDGVSGVEIEDRMRESPQPVI